MTGGRTLFSRLLATHLIVAVATLALLGITLDRVFERRAVRDLETQLIAEARATRASLEGGISEDLVRRLGTASGARLTVIRTDGTVLADSEHDPSTMENHADRPEVRVALSGRIGSKQRVSGTLGRPFLYVAIPPRDGVIVRAALPANRVTDQRRAIRLAMLAAFAASAILAAGLSALLARNVAGPLSRISRAVRRVSRGEFHAIAPEGPREARDLVAAVNTMAADLAARVAEIGHETALREQVLSAMDEAVILADDDRVIYANPAARAMFTADPMPAVPPAITAAGPAPEITLHHPVRRDVRIASANVEGGRRLIVAQDVTEARRIDRIRRDFVANASHEMKTPVAGILAAAETLQTAVSEDPEAAERFTASLAQEARRLSELVQDLLDLARLEQQPEAWTDLDLSSIVREVAERARIRCDAAGLGVDVKIAQGLRVRGRSEDLAQLTRNLLDNAIRYTPSGGSIAIHLSPSDGAICLEVSDTGVGIPAADVPRVFERFFRVDQARARATGGTGLGLAIVRHVAESHGGSVAARSELGKGSTFTVTLPRAAS